MVKAMLKRARSFTRGGLEMRFNLRHLLAFGLVLFTVSGFFHLYLRGFFTAFKAESSTWHFGTTPSSRLLSRQVSNTQTRVGKAIEDIPASLAEAPAGTLEQALQQLKSERKKMSNLLLDVAVTLNVVQSYLDQVMASGGNGFVSHIHRPISDDTHLRERRDRESEGPGDVKVLEKNPLEDDKEEGEWAEAVKEEVPLMEFFEIEEIRKYIKPRPNRHGRANFMGANATYAAIGHACVSHKFELEQYMDYDVGDYCNDDWRLGQKLMVHGCDPLPRRRCLARAPKTYQKPLPINESMWTFPDDRNVRWDSYICKGFKCLAGVDRKGFFKCNECFNLDGHEKPKWMEITNTSTEADFLMDDVLNLKPGQIRIGLDFSIGVGTFAARMRERNITIASATLNLGAPFNEAIALRGLLPLYLSVNQRLPFFDNTLDIVHSTLFLDGWIDPQLMDYIIYDWDRVLRPGGLLWIDRFFCKTEDMDNYLYYFDQLRYRRLMWVVAPKVDKDDTESWFSAVLEKPPRPF